MKHIVGKLLMTLLAVSMFIGGYTTLKAQAQSDTGLDELNYMVVESPYLDIGGEQKVVASIGGENISIAEAILKYENRDTGVSYQQKAEKIVENAVLFRLPFTQDNQKGIYELKSIAYTTDGKQNERFLV